MVGFDTADDAGVYRLDEDKAIVVTADIIGPPVDDPFLFGQIAAANSLSDVYAMGGKPLTCLNLVFFPSDKLEPGILHGIIEGAHAKVSEAGSVIAGGHSVEDQEPKFGLSVTGLVHPDKYWSNAGAKPGDCIILTKPLGGGVLLNANMKGKVSGIALENCLNSMVTLNDKAADVFRQFEVHAVTDVTGFGLGGHALGMARASNVNIEIDTASLPLFDEAQLMYEKGFSTGINLSNHIRLAEYAEFSMDIPASLTQMLSDPQTSGGLLTAVPEADSDKVLSALEESGVRSAVKIGHVSSLAEDRYLTFT
jgi:selenide, water dikinase